MSDTQKNNKIAERNDEATDPRTLDEIEDEEELASESTPSSIPAPDEGSGRPSDDDAGGPM